MNVEDYDRFTAVLTQTCQQHPTILGLIALGSMAQQDYEPDQWSDHDFFLITPLGQQETLKKDLTWLPNADTVVLAFQDAQHEMRFLYADGHLVELAVFDLDELQEARINRYRVLIDKDEITEVVEGLSRKTAVWAAVQSNNVDKAMAHFLSNIWVGYGRFQRGEKLNAHEFIAYYALLNLLNLITHYLPTENKGLLDNLNPFRRFEKCYPKLGQDLYEALNSPIPEMCKRLMEIGERELAPQMSNFPTEAFEVVNRHISRL